MLIVIMPLLNHLIYSFVGGVKLISLSCGAQNVWAVDSHGQVYLRIGLKPPSKNYLSPAWVPVDGSTHNEGAKFVKVVTGPSDWVVCMNCMIVEFVYLC